MKCGAAILVGISALAISSEAFSLDKYIVVKVKNRSTLSRASEMISIPWGEVKKRLPSIEPTSVVVFDGSQQLDLVTQVTNEELLFLSDFKPQETKSFIVNIGLPTKPLQSFVDGRFVEPRQDYAWENDRIAFRMYGPALAKEVGNGIDVWTKRVRALVVEKWYKGEEDTGSAKLSYHVDRGEGADFFSVGKSLGAGSCGIWRNGRVHQPGVFSSYKTICNGPLRVMFELCYDSLRVDGTLFREVKQVTLDAGRNLNKIEVSYTGAMGGEKIQFAAGLVKRKTTSVATNKTFCWMSLWGNTNDDTTNGSLGTGVVTMKSSFSGFAEDEKHFLITGNAVSGKRFTYYSGAGWTRSGDFATRAEWEAQLDGFARKLETPMKISFSNR